MRVYLCEHCLGQVLRQAEGWFHEREEDDQTCHRVPTNPVRQLRVHVGPPDRQSAWEFERAELVNMFERERAQLTSALIDVWFERAYPISNRTPLPEDRWVEIRDLVKGLQ